MPSKNRGKGATGRFNIRLDSQTADFYRHQAHLHGISLSEFLRQTLVQGVIEENVQAIEARLKGVMEEIGVGGQSERQTPFPEALLLSILTTEALIRSLVEKQDVNKVYDAQDQAARKLKELTNG